MRFSQDGSRLLVKGGESVSIWQVSTGKQLSGRSMSGLVDANFLDSNTVLLSTATNIRKVDAATGAITPGSFISHAGARGYFAVSPQGLYLTATDGSMASIYRLSDKSLLNSFAVNPAGALPHVQYRSVPTNDSTFIIGASAYRSNGTLFGTYRSNAGPASMMAQSGSGNVYVGETDAVLGPVISAFDWTTGAFKWSKPVGGADQPTLAPLSGAAERTKNAFLIGGNSGLLGSIRSFATSGGVLKATMLTPFEGQLKFLACSPGTNRFAFASQIGGAANWRVSVFELNDTQTAATLLWERGVDPATLTLFASGPDDRLPNGFDDPTGDSVVYGYKSPAGDSFGVQVRKGPTGGTVFLADLSVLKRPRSKQIASWVWSNWSHIAVVTNEPTANLHVYNITKGKHFVYPGKVTSVAPLYGDLIVVDGPRVLKVDQNGITEVPIPNVTPSSTIIDPASFQSTSFTMIKGQDLIFYTTSAGEYGRVTLDEPIADTFNSIQKVGVLTVGNTPGDTYAKVRLWKQVFSTTPSDTKLFTLDTTPTDTFGGWAATSTVKWIVVAGTKQDATGQWITKFFMWHIYSQEVFEWETPVASPVTYLGATRRDGNILAAMANGGTMLVQLPVEFRGFFIHDNFGGDPVTINIDFTAPTPVPQVVTISSSIPGFPTSVKIEPGTDGKQFTWKSPAVDVETELTATATLGARTYTKSFKLFPAQIASVACPEGGSTTGSGPKTVRVNLEGRAGSSGVTVSLSSSDPVVTVPSSVTIPAGGNTLEFTANVGTFTSKKIVNIFATYDGKTVSERLVLKP